MKRILVTGSRNWTDEEVIVAALVPYLGAGTVLVHGKCPTGADAIAAKWWTAAGGIEEAHPADWQHCEPTCPINPPHGRYRLDGTWYCPMAGLRRNQEMVDLGAEVCLAFIGQCTRCYARRPHPSHGSSRCADMAKVAGIPVVKHFEKKRSLKVAK